jgi:hypothetical protein
MAVKRILLSGALRAVVGEVGCPSGEQIVNGGFEEGWTGWDHNEYAFVTEGDAHSGVYKCWLYWDEIGGEPIEEHFGWVEQILPTPITVDCVQSLKFWAKSQYGASTFVYAIITYTDDSVQSIEVLVVGPNYTECDITANLIQGKTIKKIRFTWAADPFYLDDVSLIGKG